MGSLPIEIVFFWITLTHSYFLINPSPARPRPPTVHLYLCLCLCPPGELHTVSQINADNRCVTLACWFGEPLGYKPSLQIGVTNIQSPDCKLTSVFLCVIRRFPMTEEYVPGTVASLSLLFAEIPRRCPTPAAARSPYTEP